MLILMSVHFNFRYILEDVLCILPLERSFQCPLSVQIMSVHAMSDEIRSDKVNVIQIVFSHFLFVTIIRNKCS